MYCKKCGAMISSRQSKCEKCGWEVPQNNQEAASSPIEEQALTVPEQNTQKAEKTKWSVWCYLAVVSLCCGAFTFYKGLDKMFRYDSGDSYPHKYVNAYVGGDAYNYIINGTYETAFFVLTAMFVLAAIGLVVVHYVSQKEEK